MGWTVIHYAERVCWVFAEVAVFPCSRYVLQQMSSQFWYMVTVTLKTIATASCSSAAVCERERMSLGILQLCVINSCLPNPGEKNDWNTNKISKLIRKNNIWSTYNTVENVYITRTRAALIHLQESRIWRHWHPLIFAMGVCSSTLGVHVCLFESLLLTKYPPVKRQPHTAACMLRNLLTGSVLGVKY